MNKGLLQKLLPHIVAIAVFLIVALIYCSPVLSGEVLQQHDVIQWKAMAQNSFVYKETHGHFPLWTNGMFSGMPAYQIAMDSQNPVQPGWLYNLFTLFLPKPISFFFLACLSFYFLTQVLRTNPYLGIFGALAYAYATYNPIIVSVGHDTKMQSIALIPAFIGSLILVYERNYLWGAALTALSTVLLVGMNHPQIAYYTFIIAFFMTAAYVIRWIRKGEFRHLGISLAIVAVAGLLGVLSNAVSLFTTYEYSKATIRGGTELADSTTNSTSKGLSREYALSYSLYKSEPFVMMVPNMYGGSSEAIEEKLPESKAMEALQGMPQELANQIAGVRSAYWGGIGQVGTSGPPYVGAIICFLALIGFFILDNKHKWWILATCVLTILMSWGEYFMGFNGALLDLLPLYNKFRAPSMIIVVPTFLLGMMAVMTLQKIISMDNKAELWDRYKKGLILTGAVFVVLLLIYFSADYTSLQDKNVLTQIAAAPEQVKDYIRSFLNALKDDRKSLFMGSMVRSFFFMAAAALVIWLSVKNRMRGWMVYTSIGLLAFIDLMAVDAHYLNSKNYQEETDYQNNFSMTPADQQILQDKSYYRVLDLSQGIGGAFNGGAMRAYYHKLVGGYHPAKLSIYQDLVEHQLYNFPQCLPVINMLNTKYVIQPDQSGKETVIANPDALGPAWFVQAVRFESTPKAVMNALTTFHPRDTAIVFAADQALVKQAPTPDSAASILLVKNDNDEVTYTSKSSSDRFAVFSEIFYNKGWKAYIDDKEAPIIRTNYVLRGLSVPAGQHNIRFVFHPAAYYTGNTLALIAGILVFLLLIAAIVQSYRKRTPIA